MHKTLQKANDRVLEALQDTAEINKLDVISVDPSKGFLVGYSPGFRSRVFLVYSPKSGMQLWYDIKANARTVKSEGNVRESFLKLQGNGK